MAEEHGNHADSQQFSQTIARLAGNANAGEQHHGVKRENYDAAHESFLLGNDGENEIVMRDPAGQIAEGVLSALAPALAHQTAGTNRDEGLLDVIGGLADLPAHFGFLSRGGVFGTGVHAKVNLESSLLVVLELNLPVGRGEENVHEDQEDDEARTADEAKEEANGHSGHIEHGETDRQENEGGTEIRLVHDQKKGEDSEAERLPENNGEAEFLRGPAEEMCLGEDEGELGELRGLRLEESQINPAARAPAMGFTDARNEDGNEEQNCE